MNIVYIPEYILPEILYDFLVMNRDYEVQYLLSIVMDMELCSGIPMTCPYGEYSDCCKEPDFSADEPPPDLQFDENKDFELPF